MISIHFHLKNKEKLNLIENKRNKVYQSTIVSDLSIEEIINNINNRPDTSLSNIEFLEFKEQYFKEV